MSVSGVSSQSPSGGIASDSTTIAGNFDTFLSLLTTQLQNQDPLDPLDTNQFTQQLVEFSSVEQELKSNDYLSTLVQSTQNSANNAAVSYIGKEVTATGVDSDLKNGQAVWSFSLPQAANVNVVIKDSQGNQVYTESGQVEAGQEQFTWDGTKSDGTVAADGTYSISITAKTSNGTNVAADTETTGTVTGVDLSGSEPSLIVGSQSIKLSDVTSVRTPSS
ncbi:MAG TPA: flagellar hook capping FlgD N-terminal domain-containing protein [Devosia sp.]|nr:flagellar hook capping FlgD N-terminal domain-containing protein [Devosia sp.]